MYIPTTGTYKFIDNSDDGARLWINGKQVIDQWKDETGTTSGSTSLAGNRWHSVQLDYYENDGSARVKLEVVNKDNNPVSGLIFVPLYGNGLSGNYYPNKSFETPSKTVLDSAINFNWGSGSIPNVSKDNVGVRWKGLIKFPDDGQYKLVTDSDDAIKVIIDTRETIYRGSSGWAESTDTFKGGIRQITVEYVENTGDARVRLYWSKDNAPAEIIPATAFINLTSTNQVPNFSASASISPISEGSNLNPSLLEFKIRKDSGTIPNDGINVFYRIVPTTNGELKYKDLGSTPGHIEFNSTDTEKTITIKLQDDNIAETGETIGLEILPGNYYYNTTVPTVSITDNEPTISMFVINNNQIQEGTNGQVKLTFDRQFDRSPSSDYAIILNFKVSNPGNTESGDYKLLEVKVNSNNLVSKDSKFEYVDLLSAISAINDDIVDLPRNGENVTIELVQNDRKEYFVGTNKAVTFNLNDNQPTIGITKIKDGSESTGNNAEFQLNFSDNSYKQFVLQLKVDPVTSKDRSDLNKYVKTTGTQTIRGNYIDTPKGADYLVYWRYPDNPNDITKKEYILGDTIIVESVTGTGDKAIIIGVEPIDDDVAENTESVTIELVQKTTQLSQPPTNDLLNANTNAGLDYYVDPKRKSATATIADNEPTLELVTVRNAKEYGEIFGDQDSYSIGYIELKADKPITNALGIWVKYTITVDNNVVPAVDYLNSQYRKVSLEKDTQQNGIIIPRIEELNTTGNQVVDASKIRIYFVALPDAIKENTENITVNIQPYHFDTDTTDNKNISNFSLKQNGEVVDKITAEIKIEDSGLFKNQVFILDQNDQLVTSNNPLVVRNGQATLKLKLGSQPLNDVTIKLQVGNNGKLSTSDLTFKSSQWDKYQTVNLSGVTKDFSLTGTATSSDPNYNSTSVAINIPVTTTIPVQTQVTEGVAPQDLGVPKVSLFADERVNENTNQPGLFRVQLSNPSKQNLEISYRIDGSATSGQDYEVGTTGSIKIAAGDTVGVLPIFPKKDDTVEDNETVTLTLEAGNGYTLVTNNQTKTIILTNADTAGLQISNVSFDIVNVDSNGQPIPLIAGTLRTLQTSENGNSETIAIRLQSKPTADVKVKFDGLVSSEGEIRLYQGAIVSELTFTATNWDQYQLVTVVGRPDQKIDGNQTYQIQAQTSSADANYQDLNVNIPVVNDDTDAANVNLAVNRPDPTLPLATIIGGNVTINESGGQQELQINLDKPANKDGVYVVFSTSRSDALGQDYTINSNTIYFNDATGDDSPFNGITASGIAPAFGDLDKDGDLDLVLGKSDGKIQVFHNIGSSTSPLFLRLTGKNNPFNAIDVGTNSVPVFADLDNDGDLDGIIGTGKGTIRYYENISNSTGVRFGIRNGKNNPFDGIDVGDNSAASFADLDSDGDLDAIIGTGNGTIRYYRNTGTSSKPSFTRLTSTDNPFNAIDIGNNNVPNLADIDKDGDFDLFMGAEDGKVYLYRNNGNKTSPSFVIDNTGNPAQSWKVNSNSKPVFVDLNNDGNLDAVIGSEDGNLQYQQQWNAVFIPEGETSGKFTVKTVDDKLAENTEIINLGLVQGTGYLVDPNQPNQQQQTLTILDDDQAGILIKDANGLTKLQFSTKEDNSTPLNFTVELTSQPTDTVNVSLTSTNETEGLLTLDKSNQSSTIVVNFTPDNWNKPRSFSVVPQNDAVQDGQIRYAILTNSRSNDVRYNDTSNYGVGLGIKERLIDLGQTNNQILASSLNSTKSEEKEKAFDNNPNTKWLIFASEGWIEYPTLNSPGIVNSYSLTSANDFPARDPQNWEFQGSNDGVNFDILDRRTGIKFNQRFETKTFDLKNSKPYRYYRLNVLANGGAKEMQLAEFDLYVNNQLVIANDNDSDTAGFTITPISGSNQTLGDAFTIKLNSQPVGKVIVTMKAESEQFYFVGKQSGDDLSITFDSQNWSVEQTVQVTAIDDNVAESTQKSTIGLSVTGEDAIYNNIGATLKPVEVIVKDNDPIIATIKSGKPAAEIFSTPGYFIVELNRDPNNLPADNTGIDVNYQIIGGSGTVDVDYESIKSGKIRVFGTQAIIPIVPIDDKKVEDITLEITNVTRLASSNGKTRLKLNTITKTLSSESQANDPVSISTDSIVEFAGNIRGDVVSNVQLSPKSGGLLGEYYNSRNLTGNKVLSRIDSQINLSLGGDSPAKGVVNTNSFSVRWTGFVVLPPVTGEYTFYTNSDDGVRLWVNNQQIINNWTDHGPTENSGKITLEAEKSYDIKLEYYENTGGATIQLFWQPPNSSSKQLIPSDNLMLPAAYREYTGDIEVNVPDSDAEGLIESIISNKTGTGNLARIPSETVIVELKPGDGYQLGSAKQASLNIIDNDVPGVRIVQGGNRTVAIEDDLFKISADDTIRYSQFEVSLLSEPDQDVTITLTSDTIKKGKKQLQLLDLSNPNQPKPVDSLTLTFKPENWYQLQTVNIQGIDDGFLEDDTNPQNPHEAIIKYKVDSKDATYQNVKVTDQTVTLVDRVLNKTKTTQGVDSGFKTLQSTIDNLELPIIGSLQGRSPTVIQDLGNAVVKSVSQVEPDNLTSTNLETIIENALAEIDLSDVDVVVKMTDTDVYFAFDFSKQYNLFELDLSSDLGVPALGIGFQSDGQLTGDFKFDVSLGFGMNKLLGFYLDPEKTKIHADITLQLNDFKGRGKLGFVQVDFADDAKNRSKLQVSFDAWLEDPQKQKEPIKVETPPKIVTIDTTAKVETTPADELKIPVTQALPPAPTEKKVTAPVPEPEKTLPSPVTNNLTGVEELAPVNRSLNQTVGQKTVQYNQNLAVIQPVAALTSTFTGISATTLRTWLSGSNASTNGLDSKIINLLNSAAPEVKIALRTLLKDAVNIDVGLNDRQLQISYEDTVDLVQLLATVPGVRDLPLKGLKLPVGKPRLTISNLGMENAQYTLAVDSLPKAELINWLSNQGKTLIPTSVQNVLNQLANLANNLDLVLGSDQIQVGYKGNIDLAGLITVIPGVQDLPLSGLNLPVTNPTITINNPSSPTANYTFKADSLPKQELINWLSGQAKNVLPAEVRGVLGDLFSLSNSVDLALGAEQIGLTYKGTIDLANLVKTIPGVKDLPLTGLTLPVTNPSITITNPKSGSASYVFAAESLPKQQLADWLKNQALNLIPASVKDVLNQLLVLTQNIDLVLGQNQIEVAYKGNLDLAQLMQSIPGVKDLPLTGLTLPVTNPRLTVTNPTGLNPDFAFAVDSLPKEQLVAWLGNQAKSLLPQEVQTVLNQLMAKDGLDKLDLILGNQQLQLTYQGDFPLDQLLLLVPGISKLPLQGLSLPVSNPSLTIINLGAKDKPIDYAFAVDRLPKDELINWLKTQAIYLLPGDVVEILNNLFNLVKNVDLKLGKNDIQIGYLGDLDLATLFRQIPGLQDLSLTGLNLPVTNPRINLTNLNGNADVSLSADKLPKQQLIDWLVQQLPGEVQSILNQVSNVADKVDILFGEGQLQLGYQGNVDLAAIARLIPGIKELPNLETLALPVGNPRLSLSNLGTGNIRDINYSFSSDSLPKTQLANWVKTSLVQQLPSDVQSFINQAIDLVQNVDVKFGSNQIQISYLGDLNLKTIIDQITSTVGNFLLPLKGLDLTLSNPSLTITNPKTVPSFSLGIDKLSMAQVKTWLTQQITSLVGDENVRNFLNGMLNEIANIDLAIGDTQTQITYLGTVDLGKALNAIPGIESITPDNLSLPIINPSFTITRVGSNKQYSLSAQKLPKEELTAWLKGEALSLLPQEVQSIVNSLFNVADQLDVQLGSSQIQLAYQGNLDLATIVKEIPGIKELPLNNLQLPVLNPRVSITNPGKNASYSFAVEQLPKQQLIDWVKSQLPTEVQSILDKIAGVAENLDVLVSSNLIQIAYNGSIDLASILSLVPGINDLLTPGISLNIVNPTLTILNPGKSASYSFSVDKLPKKELLDLIRPKLPSEIQSVLDKLSDNLDVVFGQGKLEAKYVGDIDLVSLVSLIPGVKDLPLNGLKLNVTNPSFTLIKTGASSYDYTFAADRLPTQDLINWAKNAAADVLPADIKDILNKLLNIAKDINLNLGNGQIQLAYNGDLDVAQVLGLIPGLQDVSVFKGLNLPVTNPSITIINPSAGQTRQYLFKADRLPKEELAKWAKEKATELLPSSVAPIINSLVAIAQGIDLEVGTNQLQLSYQGTVDLSDILEQIPGVKELPIKTLDLPVLNPSLTIVNPGKNASYSFAADKLPKEQLISWLQQQAKDLLPIELQAIFDTLSQIAENLDIRIGDSQLQIMYRGNLNLVDIMKSIPGLSTIVPNNLSLNVQNPSITITNPGRNAEFSFQADRLPIADLKNWLISKVGSSLPQTAKDIINGITGVAQDINILMGKNDVQLLYNGTLDIVNILSTIPGVKDVPLPPAGTLTVTNPSLTLTRILDNAGKSSYDFNFAADKLNKEGLKTWLIDAANNALPQSVRDLVSSIIDTAADFEVLFKNNKLQISYPGTLDMVKVIAKIPGLSELQTSGLTLPITNPILTIYDLDKGISKAQYTFGADHLPKEELVDWLTKQVSAQLPQSVLSVVKDLLELAKRIDVQLGSNSIQITYQGVLDLARVLEKIPGINQLSFSDLTLPITNPSFTITKPIITANGTTGTWKDANFSFRADKLPTTELATWLGKQAAAILPSSIADPVKQIITAFGPVNLSLTNDKFQFVADTVKLNQVIQAIPGLNSIFTTIPDITLQNTSLTLSNFGKDANGQSTTKYQFATSGLNLGSLASSLGLPSNISSALPTVNLFISNDRVLFAAPGSIDLKCIVPLDSLDLPDVITKYIPEIKLDNAQLNVINGSSGKEINLNGTVSGLNLGLIYTGGKWTSKGIDDGGRLSILDLVDLIKLGKTGDKQGFYNLVQYKLVGDANLGLTAETSINGSPVFPAFSFDLAANFPIFNYGNQKQASQTGANIKLNNIKLDLGSFISNLMGPVIRQVNQIIEPIKPVIKLLQTDTVLFTTIGLGSLFDTNKDGKVTILEVAETLVPPEKKAQLQTAKRYIKAVGDIVDLISTLSKLPANERILIDMGSYTLSGVKAASKDPKNGTNQIDTSTNNKATTSPTFTSATNSSSGLQTNTSPIDPTKQVIAATTPTTPMGSFFNKLKNTEGLQFPVLTSPMNAINLLLGKTTDLVIYDIPDLNFSYGITKNYPIYPPFGIFGQLKGEFTAQTNLVAGFDTYGVNKWIDDGYDPAKIYEIFDGFYLKDWDAQGKDIDELVLTATIAAGVGIDVGVADAFVRGGVQGRLGLDVTDVGEDNNTSDGKIRGSEIISRISDPLSLFDLNGSIDAFLDTEIRVKLGLFTKTVYRKEFARFNLAKFSLSSSGFSSTGAISQSYIAGATIFFDTNFNYQWDEGEVKTISDEYGAFVLELPDSIDTNQNRIIDITEGQLVARDGFDTSSGLPSGALIALPNSTILTPLTSVQAKLVQDGLTVEEANNLLTQQLGLDSTLVLENFDPLEAVGQQKQVGLDTYLIHIQVQALSLLDGFQIVTKSNNLLNTIYGFAQFLKHRSLKTTIPFDFTSEAEIRAFLDFLLQAQNLKTTAEKLDAIAQIVAAGNQLLLEVSKVGGSKSTTEALPALASVKRVVQGSSIELIQQLIKGQKSPQQSLIAAQEFLNQNFTFVDSDLNAFGNRTIQIKALARRIDETNGQSEFEIQLSQQAPNQGLKILYSLSGTATLGADYQIDSKTMGELYIAPGETSAKISISTIDDQIAEPVETITINLKSVGEGYLIDPTSPVALIRIQDNETAIVDQVIKGITLEGTIGDDSFIAADGNDKLEGSYGNDFFDAKGGDDIVNGGYGDDILLGGEGDDWITGGHGNDNLEGNAGNDQIDGGSGNDYLQGGEGADILNGGMGNDTIEGNGGNDQIDGGDGNDILLGNEDNDWLTGQVGNDILIGGTGDDILNGGEGADVFYFSSKSEGFDTILDFNPEQGDKIQVSKSGFAVNNLDGFRFISGVLDFQGQNLALIQNDGRTYSYFPNLSDIIQLVETPTVTVSTEAKTIETQLIVSANLTEQTTLTKFATIPVNSGEPTVTTSANPDNLLAEIQQRGYIRFSGGRSDSISGVFDYQFVRAIAAAIFGDANRVDQVPGTFSESFSQVANKQVDLSTRHITQNLVRDGELNVDFGPVYYYDFLSVLVRNKSGIQGAKDLNGKKIGVVKNTTALTNLDNLLDSIGVQFTAEVFDTQNDLYAAYNLGEVDAIASDKGIIYDALEREILENKQEHRFLDIQFSKEPIGLVIPENESEWGDVVRWVVYTTIQAEEYGINSQNIDRLLADNTDDNSKNDSDPAIRRFLGLEGSLGSALELPQDFVVQVIKQVGNYGEIYQRSFPSLTRDLNLLSLTGGLLESLPFSGRSFDQELVNNDQRNLLAEIQNRGFIKYGLPQITGSGFPGFAEIDSQGQYKGFDVDLSKAIAAAVFGDPSKVEYTQQAFANSFANTANGLVDVSAAGYTGNLMRDAGLGVDYSPVYIHTGQGILTRKDSGITGIATLNGSTIGALTTVTAIENLSDLTKKFGSTIIITPFDDKNKMYAAYEKGEIDAVYNDKTLLAGIIPTLSDPQAHEILPETFSKEPLTLILDENQSDWADVVRWVMNSLVQAEEYGITSTNIDDIIAKNRDNDPNNNSIKEIQAFLGLQGNPGASLGLSSDFVVKMIKAVGNYGEIYARNFDTNILPREKNDLYHFSGLQYALPLGSLNQPPSFTGPDIFSIDENTRLVGIISTKDPEQDAITFALGGVDYSLFAINPSTGELTFNTAPNFEIRLDQDKNHLYQLQVIANDTKNNQVSQNISIRVTDVNESPIAEDDRLTLTEVTTQMIDPLQNDRDPDLNDQLKIISKTDGQYGRVDIRDNQLVYTLLDAYQSYAGNDIFTYTISDAKGLNATGSVNVMVKEKTIKPNSVVSNPFITINSSSPLIPTEAGTQSGIVDQISFRVPVNYNPAQIKEVLQNNVSQTSAAFNNIFGLYEIDDSTGRVNNILPGQLGYAEAALSKVVTNFAVRAGGSGNTVNGDVIVNGGKTYAPFVIANGGNYSGSIQQAINEFFQVNPNNSAATAQNYTTFPVAYFSFGVANPDGAAHIKNFGNNVFGFEDLPAGVGVSDYDFNDMLFSFG
ncbi:MAG: transporter substrate-binding domain-containing protein [Cyanobacteria bacterium REEB494]|nr:transporter substrate-binding domain-containing protein [Cyanobacteria bacterium REEB494]